MITYADYVMQWMTIYAADNAIDPLIKWSQESVLITPWIDVDISGRKGILKLHIERQGVSYFTILSIIQVCISRLHDFQLAMVLARLYEEDTSRGPLYTRILKECLLGQGDNAHEPIQGKV